MRVAVTYTEDAREDIAKQGDIVFEDLRLMPGFLFLDTDRSMDDIRKINGVTHVREEYKYRVDV